METNRRSISKSRKRNWLVGIAKSSLPLFAKGKSSAVRNNLTLVHQPSGHRPLLLSLQRRKRASQGQALHRSPSMACSSKSKRRNSVSERTIRLSPTWRGRTSWRKLRLLPWRNLQCVKLPLQSLNSWHSLELNESTIGRSLRSMLLKERTSSISKNKLLIKTTLMSPFSRATTSSRT